MIHLNNQLKFVPANLYQKIILLFSALTYLWLWFQYEPGGNFDRDEIVENRYASRVSNRKISRIEPCYGWQWCWWQRYVGDLMMVTDLRCWWQNHFVGDFFRYVGNFFDAINRSPTSSTYHQYILSPTSVTIIDVTLGMLWLHREDRVILASVRP